MCIYICTHVRIHSHVCTICTNIYIYIYTDIMDLHIHAYTECKLDILCNMTPVIQCTSSRSPCPDLAKKSNSFCWHNAQSLACRLRTIQEGAHPTSEPAFGVGGGVALEERCYKLQCIWDGLMSWRNCSETFSG